MLIDFNKDIVDSLKKKGSEAVSITSKLNNIINVVPDSKKLVLLVFLIALTEYLKIIISQNQIPVIAPLGIDKNKNTFNINGDTAASAIAKNLNLEDFYL